MQFLCTDKVLWKASQSCTHICSICLVPAWFLPLQESRGHFALLLFACYCTVHVDICSGRMPTAMFISFLSFLFSSIGVLYREQFPLYLYVNRLRYKGGLNQQGKKLHKNSFVSVNIFSQLRYLLESECIHDKVLS